MRVSLNHIKQYIDFELPAIDELVSKINRQLGGVEEFNDLSARYEGAVIVLVKECQKHPNADKLNVCMVDDGSGELTQVVCGAPNARAGMYAIWLKPGATVPATATDDEPYVLGARELRGVMSNGMLASAKELGIGDSHDGIVELTQDDLMPGSSVQLAPGLPFGSTFGFDDTTIDIENKMFTHRPDLFGQLGVAREIAGIHGRQFTSPEWYLKADIDEHASSDEALDMTISNEADDVVPRFMAVCLRGVEIKPSPLWLQCELVRMGGKPINNIVDATNYIMFLTAQPTHAYDYGKLRGQTLKARRAQDGETATLLNGKSYTFTTDDIVIADGEGPVGLGGIMGGANSEVSSATTDIVLEVASFDMYAVRKSSMRHGLFTDALTRFNKGQSPYQSPYVLAHLIKLIRDVAGGVIASGVFDQGNGFDREYAASLHGDSGRVSADFINRRLGLSLTTGEIAELLRNVEFNVQLVDGDIEYRTPYWRTDIEQAEDIVEEIGRLYGYDALPRDLPRRSIAPAPMNQRLTHRQAVRRDLRRAGANEVLTYSFVHQKLLERAGQDSAHAHKLSNALSPDLQFYRLGLTPSLLDKVHPNIKAGHGAFALFELNKVHYKGEMDKTEPQVPNEDEHVALVVAYDSKQRPEGAPYYYAKRYLGEVIDLQHYRLTPASQFDFASDEWARQLVAPYDVERSAVIVQDDQVWGVVGEFTAAVRKNFKLPEFTAGFELHADLLTDKAASYRPLSRFPSVTQDVSIKLDESVSYKELVTVVEQTLEPVRSTLEIAYEPIGIYKPDGSAHKTTTLRLRVTSHEATLSDRDVRSIVETLGQNVEATLHGTIV